MIVTEKTLNELQEAQERLAELVKRAEMEARADEKMTAAVQTSIAGLSAAIDNMYF